MQNSDASIDLPLAAVSNTDLLAAVSNTDFLLAAVPPLLVLRPLERAGQPLERSVEGGVALGKTKPHHGANRIRRIEGGHRDRRHLVLGDQPPAKSFVILVEAERRQVD